jgi:hypothetical protein
LRYSLIGLPDIFSVSEIKSLTFEIEQATSRGTLVRFFNSTDDASSLKSHNDNLGRIIIKATVSQLIVHCTVATDYPCYNNIVCWCYGCPPGSPWCPERDRGWMMPHSDHTIEN